MTDGVGVSLVGGINLDDGAVGWWRRQRRILNVYLIVINIDRAVTRKEEKIILDRSVTEEEGGVT